MAFPFIILAIVLVGMIGMMLLMPKAKVENARPETLDKLNFPTAAEGSPIPLLLGSVRHRGPNTLYYGGFRSVAIKKKVKTGLFSSKMVTVGFKYYITLDLGLCLGPGVLLKRIWFDKDEVWSGSAGPDETALTIDKPSLWGGEEKGGGFVGTLRFYGGQLSQPRNAKVVSLVAPKEYPAYVGQAHIVLEDCYIGTSAQLRAMSFELARYTNSLGLGAGHNIIGSDMNGAELLYQIMTLDWGGLDVDPNDINLPSFVAGGETLFTEGNGMSLIISSANSGKDAIEEVLRQDDGVMYQDPVTGKILLSLIRKDYVLEDLMVLDESNVAQVRNFGRTSWDDTINQVRVTYNNRANKFEKGTAIVQDLANINAQGRIRSANFNFPGVTEGALATKLASREMAQVSVPVFRATLEVNREASVLRPGQAFIWAWGEFQLEQVVMRVQRFNLGELTEGRIVIDAVQDKFALDQTIFADPEPTLHEPADRSAMDITDASVAEVPYWMMQHQDFAIIPPSAANRTFVMALARNPGELYQQGYTATIEQGAESALAVDHDTYIDTAKLHTAFDRLAGFATGTTSIVIDNASGGGDWIAAASTAEAAAGSNLFLLGTELMSFETFVDHGDGTYTLNNVRRGLLDSRAVDHAIGQVLYMLSVNPVSDAEWLGTTALSGHFQSFTDKDETPYPDALVVPLVPNRRYERPLPPDYLTLGGSRTPAGLTTVGPHTVTWRARTRLSGTIKTESEAADAEEAGVTYTLRVYKNGVLQGALTQAGLAVQTADITLPPSTVGLGLIEVVAVRGGLESYTAGWIEVLFNVSAFTAVGIATTAPTISVATLGGTHVLSSLPVTTSAPTISSTTLVGTHILTSTSITTSAPAISTATAAVIAPKEPFYDLTKLLLNFDDAGTTAWTDKSASPATFSVNAGAPTTAGGYLVLNGASSISTPGTVGVKWDPNISTQGEGATSGDFCLEFSAIHTNADAGINVTYLEFGDHGSGVWSCLIQHLSGSGGSWSVTMRGAVTGSFGMGSATGQAITPGHEYKFVLEKCGNRVRFSVDGVVMATGFMNEQWLANGGGAFKIGGNLTGKIGPVRVTFAGRYNTNANFTPDAGPFPITLDTYAYNERDQIGWITANNANGWSGNTNTKSMIQFVVPAGGRWISKIRARVGTGTATQKVKPVWYDAYSDAAHIYRTGQEYVLGHNIAGSEDIEMFVNADFSASFFPEATYGLAIISEGTGWNYSANNTSPANSTRWNADTYSDGPADPFGTGTASSSSVNIFCPVSINGPPAVANPTFATGPTISGNPNVGQTLTVAYTVGVWGLPSYQWKQDGTPIGGATASTYIPVAGDETHNITCTVTLTNSFGSTNSTSAAVGPIGPILPWRYFLLEFATTPNGFIGCSTIKLLTAGSVDKALSSGGAAATVVGYTVNGSFPVTNCNDGNDTTFTTASSGSAAGVGHGIQIDMGSGQAVVKLGYRSRSDSFGTVEALKTGSIKAKSNVGDAWTTLMTIDETATPYGNNEYREYTW